MKIPNTLIKDAPSKTAPNSVITIKQVSWFDDRYYKIEYLKDGKMQTEFFASVTTKLGVAAKPFLAKWRGEVGNREADMRVFESQERGKRIHSAWYTYCTKGLVLFNPWDRPQYTDDQIKAAKEKYLGNVSVIQYQDEMLQFVKLAKWVEIVKPEFLYCEKTVYSIANRDAGTLDSLVKIHGGSYMVNGSKPIAIFAGYYVLDLKTGGQIDDDAFLQTAAYAYSAEEMKLAPIAGTIILHTGAKTKTGIEGLATEVTFRPQMDEHYNEYRVVADLWERRNRNASPKVMEFPSALTLNTEPLQGDLHA